MKTTFTISSSLGVFSGELVAVKHIPVNDVGDFLYLYYIDNAVGAFADERIVNVTVLMNSLGRVMSVSTRTGKVPSLGCIPGLMDML